MIRLLTQQVTIINPASTTDAYGNEVVDWESANRVDAYGYVEQRRRDESLVDSGGPRDSRSEEWLLILIDEDQVLTELSRVEVDGHVFEVDGPVELAASPLSGYHHSEATLRRQEG